ncbi:MAG: SDR family NAD(P)-dependent oxidoreductase [Planctomycetota bacterium]|nr:MAG: SDR family NAD(P)-dependent oxidoreductase [Planctomycetota bacterium]
MSFTKPNLSGKVAIVTGSSRGLGKAMAIGLAEAGCSVVVAAKSVESKKHLPGSIFETVQAIEAAGAAGMAVRCNVRKAEDIENLVAQTKERFGRVDVFVHNAGALWWRPVAETVLKRLDLVLEVNVRAAFHGAHCVLPHMMEQKSGSIVMISPPIDFDVLPNKVAYLLSKYSMTMLAMGLAEEVREHNIQVNSLWPATMVESQATKNHQMGTRKGWRKAEIMSDALLAVLSKSAQELSGGQLVDEEVLQAAGVTDFSPYLCEPDGEPIYIVGDKAKDLRWQERAGNIEGKA